MDLNHPGLEVGVDHEIEAVEREAALGILRDTMAHEHHGQDAHIAHSNPKLVPHVGRQPHRLGEVIFELEKGPLAPSTDHFLVSRHVLGLLVDRGVGEMRVEVR